MREDQTFERLFKTYYTPLCNYARAILRDETLCEDIVQGVFEAVWKKGIKDLKHPERYLTRAVKFGCLDHLRSKRREEPNIDPEEILRERPVDERYAAADDERWQKLTFLIARFACSNEGSLFVGQAGGSQLQRNCGFIIHFRENGGASDG